MAEVAVQQGLRGAHMLLGHMEAHVALPVAVEKDVATRQSLIADVCRKLLAHCCPCDRREGVALTEAPKKLESTR